jgi:hypothetical protein
MEEVTLEDLYIDGKITVDLKGKEQFVDELLLIRMGTSVGLLANVGLLK